MTTGDTIAKRNGRILAAAKTMSIICGEALAEIAGSMTCDEAVAAEAFLTECGNDYWAMEFRDQHVAGDTDDDDLHHKGWEKA